MRRGRSLLAVSALVGLSGLLGVPSASASPPRAGQGLLVLAKGHGGPAPLQSSNWFGYNQGTVEQGGTLFSAISGGWTVPSARQHTSGEAEFSSTWLGIGGGCVDSGCVIGDNTLIQTGTEQDVDSTGHASYSAWWEIIPAPSITVSMTVQPGDRMHAAISETVPGAPGVWTITLSDVTRGENFSQTVPYTSTMDTAEWIEETPLVIDTSGSVLNPLPRLSKVTFSNLTLNGSPAKLVSTERIELVNSAGKVEGVPSAPLTGGSTFADCAWSTTCT